MNRGYIKLWRKSKDSGFLGNAEAWQLLCWCLMTATHKPYKQLVGKQLVELQSGQLVFGRKAVAQELNSTEQKIRTALKLLENADFLTVSATNKFSIITIVNWQAYQDEQPTINQQHNQQVNQQTTSKQPTNNHKQECKTQSTREEEKILLPGDGKNAAPVQTPPPVQSPAYQLPLRGKKDETKAFAVTQEHFDTWREAFPLVDVRHELKEIKSWLVSNPDKRPAKNMARFVNSWLGREQDKQASVQAKAAARASPRLGVSRSGNSYDDGTPRNYGPSDFGALGREYAN